MTKSNELWCDSCKAVLEDPDVCMQVYGQNDTCPICNKKLTEYNPLDNLK